MKDKLHNSTPVKRTVSRDSKTSERQRKGHRTKKSFQNKEPKKATDEEN